ncbi:MAG: hypothetical protein ACOY94_18855 [Bacillota bacterium]
MPQYSPTMWQYNGLVLLCGYLQRLTAQDQILRWIGQPAKHGRGAALPSLSDTVTAAMAALGERSLPEAQLRAIGRMLPEVETWWEACAPRPRHETRLADRIAATGGAIFGEKRVNDGLIAMGRLFDPALEERFAKQALFHQGRLRVVSAVVSRLARRDTPPQPELSYMERWYDELLLRRDGIGADLHTVARLLEGQNPEARSA